MNQWHVALQDLPLLVKNEIVPLINQGKTIITMTGPLGAGKTTLVKEIARFFGISSTIKSPTFGYLQSYGFDNKTLNHFDLYRLENEYEFFDYAFDALLYDKASVNIIEWPEVIAGLLSKDVLKKQTIVIDIAYKIEDLESRIVTLR